MQSCPLKCELLILPGKEFWEWKYKNEFKVTQLEASLG